MYCERVIESLPEAPVITSLTVYLPGAKYVTAGSFSDDFVPLPRSHLCFVGFPVDISENLTINGEHPDVMFEVKLADN
jgi:hypothetical protein